jgi:adenine-specific DNA-methyltransferase
MAALDDLLARVEDPALRADLKREVATLRGVQSLGLVFERHLPESVRLHGHPVRRGQTVVVKGDPEPSPRWQVGRVKKGVAKLYRRAPEGAVLEETRKTSELVPIREFGERIYPGLRSVGKLEEGGDQPYHVVIEGENYHALEALLHSNRGQVDAIFIDPPYNTGARDWKYNNDYVSGDDVYRHSKWLAMMERRLLLARDLLKPSNSVLIVSIDENEGHRLALLLEQIFRGSKIQMVTALINPAGASIIDQFSRVDEQLFFVHIGAARPIRTTSDTTPGTSTIADEDGTLKKFQWESVLRSGGNSRRQDTKAKFFPIYVDEEAQRIVGCGDSLPLGVDRETAPEPPDGCFQQWPLKTNGSEACWQLSPPTFRRYLDEGRIRLGRKNARTGRWGISFLTKGHMRAIELGELVVTGRDRQGALIVENAEGRRRSQVGKTMWTNGAYSATEHGSTFLNRFIPGRKFPFPKSLYMVEEALRYYVGDKKDALVLDFFAGSGTTTHAVMRLNHEDGGHRRSIAVTNNEVSAEEAERLEEEGHQPGEEIWERLGIFELITRPRIEAAVTGRTPEGDAIQGSYRFRDEFPIASGFAENVEFFSLSYEDRDAIQLGAAFEAIAPLLWLKAGARGPRVGEKEGPWALPAGGRYGVLFEVDHWAGFTKALHDATGVEYAFIVTDSEALFQTVAAELPADVTPVRLYDSYLDSFDVKAEAAA